MFPAAATTSYQREPLLSKGAVDGQPNAPDNQAPIDEGIGEDSSLKLDWRYFFQPLSVYTKSCRGEHYMRFRRVHESVPILLNILLGLQHAGVAFGSIATPPLVLGWLYPTAFGKYAIQSAFIISGLGSLLQCTHFRIPWTNYHIGTGLTSFVGNSVVFMTVFASLIGKLMMEDQISAEDAYGKLLGTSAVCALFYIALTLIPRRYAKLAFPPVVSGIIVILVGMDCAIREYESWGGGTDCSEFPIDCTRNGNVTIPFGSPEYMGLGLMVVALVMVTDLFGTAFLRHNVGTFAIGVPYILSAIVTREGRRYVSGDYLKDATAVDFLWTTTFKLGFDKNSVLPLIGVYLVTYIYTTAAVTGTLEESRLDIEGPEADARIQGGLISTGITSLFSVLATGLPVAPFPENNSFIYVTRVASRTVGIMGGLWIIAIGVFGHLLALLGLEVPIVLKGGLLVPFSMIIILGGFRILTRVKWDQRTSAIIVYSLTFGLGNLVVHNFIDFALWPLPSGSSDIVQSIQFAIVSVMSVPYFTGGLAAITLHLLLPEDVCIGEPSSLSETEKRTTLMEE